MYDKYYYTFRQGSKNLLIKLYEKNNNFKIIDKIKNNKCSYQIGDNYNEKIDLSNNDILFNNFGDVSNCILFTTNDPIVTRYKIKPLFKNFHTFHDDDDDICENVIFYANLYYNKIIVERFVNIIEKKYEQITI